MSYLARIVKVEKNTLAILVKLFVHVPDKNNLSWFMILVYKGVFGRVIYSRKNAFDSLY